MILDPYCLNLLYIGNWGSSSVQYFLGVHLSFVYRKTGIPSLPVDKFLNT